MGLETTYDAAKHSLIGAIGSIWIVAYTALLRRIGTLHSGRLDTSFGGIPGNLLGNMRKVGRVYVGIHGPGLVLHRGNRKLFIGDLRVGMPRKTLIDRPVDLLTHMADKTLPALATGGRKYPDTLLFETLAQLGFASSFLPVAFLSLSQFAVKRPVVLARTC